MPPEASTSGSSVVASSPSVSSEPEQAWIAHLAELLGHPERLEPGDRRSALDRLARARGHRVVGEPVVGLDPVGPEGVERPVLEEDVDRPAHRRGAGRERGRGVELVGGAREEDEGEAVVHRVGHLARWECEAGCGPDRRPVVVGASGRGEAAERRQAADEDVAHEVAGGEDLGIGQLVADRPAVSGGRNQPNPAHERQVLRHRGLRETQLAFELVNLSAGRAQAGG